MGRVVLQCVRRTGRGLLRAADLRDRAGGVQSRRASSGFRPTTWSLRWWGTFFADPSWRRALENSLTGGAAFRTAGGGGRSRCGARHRTARAARHAGVADRAFPRSGDRAGDRARGRRFTASCARSASLGTTTGLVLAHAMLALPYVTLNTSVSLAALDPRLELAAAGLGAGPLRVFRTVTLPQILPGIFGGAIFAFVTSFDEVVLSVFLAGPIDEDVAGPHLGGHPGRICPDRRSRRDDHDRHSRSSAGVASRLVFRR